MDYIWGFKRYFVELGEEQTVSEIGDDDHIALYYLLLIDISLFRPRAYLVVQDQVQRISKLLRIARVRYLS